MKKIILSVLILCCSTIYSQKHNTVVLKDSVNIRAILQKQIADIRSKEEQKPFTTVQQSAAVQESSSGSENLFIKIFILTDVSLGLILFVLWRRRNVKIKKVEKNWLKKNIIKLREDKITARENKELRNLRKQLRLEPVCKSVNPEYVSQYAKQQSISKGELLLAARLNSYKRVNDADSAF